MEKLQQLFHTASENLSFLLVGAGVVLGLWLLGKLAERFMPQRRRVSPAHRIALIAMCGAVAAILHMLDFPLPFLAPGFYKLDFSELPVLLCSFYLGPVAGVSCEAVKILIKLLLKGTSTAFVGDFANFVVGCAMVLPAAIVYHLRKNKKTAVISLVAGTLFMAAFGSLFNAVYLIPKFSQLYGLPLETIIAMGSDINPRVSSLTSLVLLCVVPLNLIKGGVVSLLTVLLYKRIEKPIFEKFR